MSDMMNQLNAAFQEEFSEMVENAVEKAFDEYKKELPGRIARTCRFVEAHLVKTADRYGAELRFVINDVAEMKRAITSRSVHVEKESE